MNANQTSLLAIDPSDPHVEAVIEVEPNGQITIMSSFTRNYLPAHGKLASRHQKRAVTRLLARRYRTAEGASRVLTVWG